MTRKRFIKMLMSRGIQRNFARAITKRYNKGKVPYNVAFELSNLVGIGKALYVTTIGSIVGENMIDKFKELRK